MYSRPCRAPQRRNWWAVTGSKGNARTAAPTQSAHIIGIFRLKSRRTGVGATKMRIYTPVWKTFTGVPVQGALKIMSVRVRALTTLFGVVLIGGGVLLPSLAAAQSNNLDNCLHDTGDVAITACSAAIRENPRDADAYNGRGSAFVRKGQNDRALADYNEAIRLNPEYALPYFNRGLVLENKNQLQQALSDFKRSAELDPSDDDSAQAVARITAALTTRSPAPALTTSGSAPALTTSGPAPALTTSGSAPALTTSGPAPALTTRGPAPAVTTRGPAPADDPRSCAGFDDQQFSPQS